MVLDAGGILPRVGVEQGLTKDALRASLVSKPVVWPCPCPRQGMTQFVFCYEAEVGYMVEKRTKCVSVRFSNEELELIDSIREKRTRAYTIRTLALFKMPRPIPAINQLAWLELGRALGNLASVATAMRKGEFVVMADVESKVRGLRNKLIAASETIEEASGK
jgi:hypothetical protein